jgi:hypothetical protein
MKTLSILCAILLSGLGVATAGVHLVEKDHSLLDDSESRTDIWLQGGHMRVEDANEKLVFLYTADSPHFLILDLENELQSKVTIDELKLMVESFEGGAAAVDNEAVQEQMSAILEEARGSLSPEELAVMESYLGVATSDAEPETWELVNSGVSVENWSCHWYRNLRAGETLEEVWTTSSASLGLESADIRAFTSLIGMMSQLAGETEEFHELGDPAAVNMYTGYPVKRVSYSEGKPVHESRTQLETRGSLDPALFIAPAGMRQVDFMDLLTGTTDIE